MEQIIASLPNRLKNQEFKLNAHSFAKFNPSDSLAISDVVLIEEQISNLVSTKPPIGCGSKQAISIKQQLWGSDALMMCPLCKKNTYAFLHDVELSKKYPGISGYLRKCPTCGIFERDLG
ncbi:MAG: hypothetical protein JXR34_00390 [Bacteroidales bacterium]|nr:hypothetical protein [Bacteroidales bacterium]